MCAWKTIEEKQKEYTNLCAIQQTLKEQQKTLKAQRGEYFNISLEEIIFNNKKQLKEISNKLHILKIGIQAQTKRQEERKNNPKINTNTAVYKMFGKPLKELTTEEFNLYQSRKERKKRTEEKNGRKEKRYKQIKI